MLYPTDKLRDATQAQAELFNPKYPPLLVGSVWQAGEGNDSDVVIFQDTPGVPPGWQACGADYDDADFRAYRSGVYNVIAVYCPVVYAEWVHAARLKDLPKDKSSRVAMFLAAREEGKRLYEEAHGY